MNVVVTGFDDVSWRENGIRWVRSLKNLGLSGAVVDFGIPPEGKGKLNELGLVCVPGQADFNNWTVDCCLSLVRKLPVGVWLLCPPEHSLVTADKLFAQAENKFVCQVKQQEIFYTVFPLAVIRDRVKAAGMIEGIVKKYGGPLSAAWLCGPSTLWEFFAGFSRYCLEVGLVDGRAAGLENLLLNLFVVTFDGSVEVI